MTSRLGRIRSQDNETHTFTRLDLTTTTTTGFSTFEDKRGWLATSYTGQVRV